MTSNQESLVSMSDEAEAIRYAQSQGIGEVLLPVDEFTGFIGEDDLKLEVNNDRI